MIKRLFDIIFSFIGLIVLSLFFLIISILIKIDSKGSVFYKSKRAGKNMKPFYMCKFRTMVSEADKIGSADTSEDDVRITRIGKILRKFKLDEFPQLINVLKGEMSIVGPRPEVFWKVEKYTLEEKKILDVSPGMTDYASLVFSNEGEILKGSFDTEKAYNEKIRPKKIKLGLEYVNSHSFLGDIVIILKTIKKVFF